METETILADYVTRTKYDSLPSDVVEITKKAIMDVVGNALAGSSTAGCTTMVDIVKRWGGTKESTVFAFNYKVPAPVAAMINASMTAARELNDGHPGGAQHPATVTIPAALALGERKKAGGKELITAVALGVDIQCRLGWATNFSFDKMAYKRWHHSSIMGTFGAAVASGKLLGLNQKQVMNSLGLALSQSAGTLQFTTDERLPRLFQLGNACRSGVVAALFANEDFSGYADSLEGKYGLFKTYFRDLPYDLERLVSNINEQYEIVNLVFKPWPCGKLTQLPLEAALQLANIQTFQIGNIKEIRVYVSHMGMGENYPNPKNAAEAQISIPYLVAIAILKKAVRLDDISDDSIKNQQIINLARKVKIEPLEHENKQTSPNEAPTLQSKVEVELKNGNTFRSNMAVESKSYGNPNNPMSDDDIIEKFKDCSRHSIKPLQSERVNKLIDLFNNLEALDDISEITELLSV